MGSGIYIRVGTKNKDLILECSRRELIDWLAPKLPREEMQKVEAMGNWLDVPIFRLGLVLGLSGQFGFVVHRLKDEFEEFLLKL